MATVFQSSHGQAACSPQRLCGTGEWGRKHTSGPNDATDADLAKEMNELSVQERARILEELHGVADTQDETPEFVSSSIAAFDTALSKIPKPKRKALDRVIFLRPGLQSDTKFKLMFLRADYYDAKKAAARMAKFFEWKYRIFGEAKLAKDITLDDLDPKVIDVCVNSGGCLQLPEPDATGRPITMFDTSKISHENHNEMLPFNFYLVMGALEDENAQIKGLTNLTYAPSKRPSHIPVAKATENLMTAGDLMSSLPVRITGYHYCTDSPAMHFILSVIRMALGKQVRLRIRPHFGSELEMKYSLLTFGINCQNLLDCGDGKTELHDRYLQQRRERERAMARKRREEEAKTGMTQYPEINDVLIGRGRPYHEYIGTRRLIDLIDTQLDRYYQSNDRFWKTCINIEMVKKINESNGRFLQRTASGWKILDDIVAREKTANLFRYRYNILNKGGGGAKSSAASQQQKQQQQQQKGSISFFGWNFPTSIGSKRPRDDSSDLDDSVGSACKKPYYDTDSM